MRNKDWTGSPAKGRPHTLQSEPQKPSFRYALDQWPPLGPTCVFAWQWLVILIPGLLVMGEVVGSAQGLAPAERVDFVQRLFLLMGLFQIIQVFWGHRMPGLVGPSGVVMVGVLGTASSGLNAVYWSVALGGLFTALAGVTGLAARLNRLFTLPVLAATMVLVAVMLVPASLPGLFNPQTSGGPMVSFLFGFLLILAMFAAEWRLGGLAASSVVLAGMVGGSLVYYALGLAPVAGFDPHTFLWFSLPGLNPGPFKLDPMVLLSFLFCYLALISNELVAVEVLGRMLGQKDTGPSIGRAVTVSGLGGVAGGLLGVPGPVTYTVSPVVLLATKSASRLTLLPTALLLLLGGVFPGGLYLFRLVPSPVVAAVLLYLLAQSTVAAFQLYESKAKFIDLRGGSIIAFAMMTGIVVSFMPESAARALPDMARPILANGFFMGLIMALILEHLLMPKAEKT